MVIPFLLWLLCGEATSLPYDCELGFAQWETSWSPAQQEFCCSTMGRGCSTALPNPAPTVPPTPFPTPRQGLPESRRWLCDVLQAIRLQCWFRKLDGGLVRGKEGLVLQQRRQGLPTCSWWVCLEVAPTCLGNDSAARPSRRFSLIVAALAFVPSSGAQPQLSDGSDRRGE